MKTVHQKVKDFNCPHCSFKASRVSNLKGHINAIHLRIQYYVCPFCSDEKSRTNYFTKHLNQKHDEELNKIGVSADMVRYGVGFTYRQKHKLFSAKKPKNYSDAQMERVLRLLRYVE
jgi:hypothetical protein